MKEYLRSFQILSDLEIDSLMRIAKSKQLKKGDFFIREGQVSNEVAFIVSGLFRSFYYSSNRDEVTYCFTFENSFLAAYSSFITGSPTQENLQALSNAELLIIPRQTILGLEKESSNWLRLFKVFAELEYVKMEKRIFLLQRESAERRYEDLLKNNPEYLQLIPLNHLASYLGITQRHLSRIRGSITF